MTFKDLQSARPQQRSWSGMIWLCVAFAMLDFVLIPVSASSNWSEARVIFFVFLLGCQLGQAGLITLIASWSGKRWIQGFAIGTVLSLFVAMITGRGVFTQSRVGLPEGVWVLSLLPCILCVSSFPFWVVRLWSLRRLTFDSDGHELHALTTKDFFLLTSFIGVLFYLFSITINAWEPAGLQIWGIAVGGAIGCALIGLIFFLPMGIMAFSSKEPVAGLGYQCLYAFCLLLAVLASMRTGSPLGLISFATMFLFAGATLSFAGGCWAVRSAGLQCRTSLFTAKRKAKITPRVCNPWDESIEPEVGGAEDPDSFTATHDPAPSWDFPSKGERVLS